jgi:hypothetical protein
VSTLSLEFNYVAHIAGRPDLALPAQRTMDLIRDHLPESGLAPIYISTTTGRLQGGTITLGARGDSFYEYLLKEWLQSSRTCPRSLDMCVTSHAMPPPVRPPLCWPRNQVNSGLVIVC